MPAASPAQVAFALDRLEPQAGRLIVTGRWSGVRGLRFMRPTLIVDGRNLLATLEHKPWAPVDGAPWTAAFPWDGGPVDTERVALSVAPRVTVPLAGGELPPEAPGGALAEALDVEQGRARRLETEVAFLRERLSAVTEELGGRERHDDALRAARDAAARAEQDRDALRTALQRAEQDRDTLAAALQRAERERDQLPDVQALREARDRSAADLQAAQAAREELAAAHLEAVAARDDAVEALREAAAQRDALAVRLERALAERDAARAEPRRPAPEPVPLPAPGDEQPLGVRHVIP
ncbi:MAG TPA: hypothetical protein VD931_18745, partial [Baekduia sp.]|nr:hypothetical protein [Baekduia sp.]